MIIEKPWTITKIDTQYCRQCKEPAKTHTKKGYWLNNNGQIVGGVEYAINEAKDCKVLAYLRLWDDQATYERAKQKRHNPEFSSYGTLDTSEFEELKAFIPRFKDKEAAPAIENKQPTITPAQVVSREFLAALSEEQLKQLSILVSEERRKRYPQKNHRKYGNINKGFTQEELDRFLAACENPTAKLVFQLQAYCGLRVMEACRVRISQVDLANRKLYVDTLKARTGDALYLHDAIYAALRDWIAAHPNPASGYLLPASKHNGAGSKFPHVSPNWVRKEFRTVAAQAGLNNAYAKSTERTPTRKERELHRLTTHSLRHYFITTLYKATKDPLVTQRSARHTDSKSTQTYINISGSDLDDAIKRAFDKI